MYYIIILSRNIQENWEKFSNKLRKNSGNESGNESGNDWDKFRNMIQDNSAMFWKIQKHVLKKYEGFLKHQKESKGIRWNKKE